MRLAGRNTWEFAPFFTHFVGVHEPQILNEPTAWLVGVALQHPAVARYCPDDLDARDHPTIPDATGKRDASGAPDHCVFVRPALEKEAQEFFATPERPVIGGEKRHAWRKEKRAIARHEAEHMFGRREFGQELSRKGITTQAQIGRDPSLKIMQGPLREAAAVLTELEFLYMHAVDQDPWTGVGKSPARLQKKILGPDPPLSGYTLKGLLARACCIAPCLVVQERMDAILERFARRWGPETGPFILREVAAPTYCDGKLKLADPTSQSKTP